MKFGPLSKPFLQVPVMSLAQKVVVSESGDEPQLEDRPEEGADLYNAILDDIGQPTILRGLIRLVQVLLPCNCWLSTVQSHGRSLPCRHDWQFCRQPGAF